jgi:hypothetical protein
MTRYYQQLLSLLDAIRLERAEQRKARLRRRKERLKREASSQKR